MLLKKSDHIPWYIIVICCSSALVTAYIAEYGFGVRPCPLCLYHRYAYIAIIASALFRMTESLSLKKLGAWGTLAACAIGLGISFYHIGVENHWFELSHACKAENITGNSVEELKQHILNTPASCGKNKWMFLGVSFTVYSAILFLGLFVLTSTTLFIQSKIDKD